MNDIELSKATERQLRDSDQPRPQTLDELMAFIKVMTEREHDYGTCVYAMSLSALATFNYVAHALGVTGFQASCADLHFISKTRRIDGPLMLVDANNMLYPQYDIIQSVIDAMDEWGPWAKKKAGELILENDMTNPAHPGVIAHWKKLAGVSRP